LIGLDFVSKHGPCPTLREIARTSLWVLLFECLFGKLDAQIEKCEHDKMHNRRRGGMNLSAKTRERMFLVHLYVLVYRLCACFMCIVSFHRDL